MIGAIIHSLEDAIADRLPAHTRFGLVEQWNTDQGLRPIQYQGGGQGAVVLQDASLDLSYWRLRGPVEQRTGDNCDEVNLLYPLRLVFLVDRTSDVCADVSGALGEIMLGIRLMERAVQTAIPGASASIVSMRAEGDTSRAVATEIPGIELPPQRALAFIDIALSITGDTDCLSNCGPYTGSEVVPGDACYYLRVCGTPEEGQVPTSESGRTVWATPGTGPAGSGDVVGPASAVNNNFAAFNLTTGKLIKDSGSNATSFDAAGAASAAQAASQPLDADLTAYANAANAAARRALIDAGTGSGDVVGPVSSTDNKVPQWDGTTGKLLKDGLTPTVGGGGASDALKLVQYSTGNGGLIGGDIAAGGIGVHGLGDPAVQGNSTSGVALYGNVTGAGGQPLRLSHLGGSGDFMACWAGGADNVFEVGQDGTLSWPLGGAALTGTRTNLGLGTAALNNTGDFDAAGAAATAQSAAISAAASDATTKANAAQAAAIAASQPLDADLTSYANAADAAARRALIGAEDAAYTLRATISADFTTSSATFVDVTGLTVTIPAGQTWVVIIDGSYQSTNAATGAGVSLTRTGSPTRSNFERRIYTAAATNVMNGAVGNIDDVGPINTTVDTINVDRHWIMTGNVKTAASACVIQVRAARGGSANNISIMAGASIIAHRIS